MARKEYVTHQLKETARKDGLRTDESIPHQWTFAQGLGLVLLWTLMCALIFAIYATGVGE